MSVFQSDWQNGETCFCTYWAAQWRKVCVGGGRIDADAHVAALRDGAVVAWSREREGGEARARRPTIDVDDPPLARPVTPGDDGGASMPTAVAVWLEEDDEGVLQIRSRRRGVE